MIYAASPDDPRDRVAASPQGRGYCPSCWQELVPKCGEIVAWHWAHKVAPECDPWHEESDWHIGWKRRFPPHNVEVVVGPHRADVLIGRQVIEFQRSPISPVEIREREQFYRANVGSMIWIFDASQFVDNLYLDRRPGRGSKAEYHAFRWLWPRKTHGAVTAPLFWDLGDGRLLRVRRLYLDGRAAGWGDLLDVEDLLLQWRDSEVVAS